MTMTRNAKQAEYYETYYQLFWSFFLEKPSASYWYIFIYLKLVLAAQNYWKISKQILWNAISLFSLQTAKAHTAQCWQRWHLCSIPGRCTGAQLEKYGSVPAEWVLHASGSCNLGDLKGAERNYIPLVGGKCLNISKLRILKYIWMH